MALLIAYYGVLLLLAFYGSHRLHQVVRHYRVPPGDPPVPDVPLPAGAATLVQLPVYNERYVVERLLRAAAALRSPCGPVRIQLLDDSTDDSAEVAAPIVAELRRAGVDLTHVRRGTREGYKAGALAEGMRLDAARPEGAAPFIAIFDADFVPGPDFLEKTLPHLAPDGTGLVQARWDHLNRDESLLTKVQSVFLDGHFILESAVRFRSGLLFNFNGTAGVFRRETIEDAGGWSGDTLTEDLDLSYRAQLEGWRFVFLSDVTAPAEVPRTMKDFKSQQARWTKGAIEVARKSLGKILAGPFSREAKLEAFVHLTNNLSYPLVVLLSLLVVPSLLVRKELGLMHLLWLDAPLLFGSSLSVGIFYVTSQRALGRNWVREIRLIPMMMSLGIGMAVGNAVGVVEALCGSATPFVRTPKLGGSGAAGARRYRTPLRPVFLAEAALAGYFALALVWVVARGAWEALPFLFIFFSGFVYGTLYSVLPAGIYSPAVKPDLTR